MVHKLRLDTFIDLLEYQATDALSRLYIFSPSSFFSSSSLLSLFSSFSSFSPPVGDEHQPVCGDKQSFCWRKIQPVGDEHPPVCGDKHTSVGVRYPPVGDEHPPVCGDKHSTVCRDEHPLVGDEHKTCLWRWTQRQHTWLDLTFLQLYIYRQAKSATVFSLD